MNAIKCITCGKELKPIGEAPTTIHEAAQFPWENGVVDIVVGNFGSCYDLNEYLVAICDPCIQDAIKAGRLISGRNRMDDAPNARKK
jgi:hypothetical protein